MALYKFYLYFVIVLFLSLTLPDDDDQRHSVVVFLRDARMLIFEDSDRHCYQSLAVRVTGKQTRVSAAADIPARRRVSAHAEYSASHRIVIKPFLFTRPSY